MTYKCQCVFKKRADICIISTYHILPYVNYILPFACLADLKFEIFVILKQNFVFDELTYFVSTHMKLAQNTLTSYFLIKQNIMRR